MGLSWQKLQDREKKLLIIMVGLVVILALYYLPSYMPNIFKYTFEPSLGGQVERNTKEFQQMLPSLNQLKVLTQKKHNYDNLPDKSLYDFINNSLPSLDQDDKSMKPVVTNQNSGSKVEIKFQSVNFDDLIAWLENLHNQYGVAVIKAEFTAVDLENTPGYVDADLVLQ